LNTSVVQSTGPGSHVSPGAQAGAVQPAPPLTWHVQPFTQSESAVQVLWAYAGRASKPNEESASNEESIK